MSGKVGIINYGFGNLASVRNALNYLDIENNFVDSPDDLKKYEKLILPGVGAFGAAMAALSENSLVEGIRDYVSTESGDLLGICLGMQLLFDYGLEHGRHQGLALIPGGVEPLQPVAGEYPVPNVGWCFIEGSNSSRLMAGLEEQSLCFYFVHSFYCSAQDEQAVTGRLNYGVDCAVVVEADRVFGCQFHPEKSQSSGLTLLRNFANI